MNREDEIALTDWGKHLQEKFDQMVEDKLGYDPIFFNLHIVVDVLNPDTFKKEEEIVLVESQKHYCEFCGAESEYYVKELEGVLCPVCYRKYKGRHERKEETKKEQKHFCLFCEKEAHYYLEELGGFICPRCLAEYENGGEP